MLQFRSRAYSAAMTVSLLFLASLFLASLFLAAGAERPQPNPTATRLCNAATLAGWHARGAEGWQATSGAIAGAAKNGQNNWLVPDRSYEDFILEFEFQCHACNAGRLLRNAPVETGANRT